MESVIVRNFSFLWDEGGSGSSHDASFYRANPDPDTYVLGDLGQTRCGYPEPSRAFLSFRPTKNDVFKRPVSFELVWKDSGSGANRDGSFWRPIPPSGYKALGLMCQAGYNPPSIDTVMCINDKYIVSGELGRLVWDDTDTGADQDFGCWDVASRNELAIISNTFSGGTTHQKPSVSPEAYAVNASHVLAAPAPQMETTESRNFGSNRERITFSRKGFPLHYHEIFGNRRQHLQDMIRIPDDHQGNRCFMGSFSQNVSDSEGGMMFVAKTTPDSSHGEVVWMDELNNKSLAGGFNHPGDLRRVGHIVVTAGQNWDPAANDIPFADKMHPGNGGQAILFYDVSNPTRPNYVGKLSQFLHDGYWVALDTDIDTITVLQHEDYYYLAF